MTQNRGEQAEHLLRLVADSVARLNDIVLITEARPIDGDSPRIVFVNEAFERKTGFSREEAIGRTPRILQGPRTQRDQLDRIRAALENWRPVKAELINYTKDGREFWMELDIAPVADETGRYSHMVAVERDITDRKHAELIQAAEARVLDMISSGASLAIVLEQIALAIDDMSSHGISSVQVAESSGQRLHLATAPNLPDGFRSRVEVVNVSPASGSCGTAVFRKQAVVVSDIANDPLWAGWQDAALRYGIRACWSTPVVGGQGRVLGTLAIYYTEVREPDMRDIELVSRFSRLVGMAIERITQDEALRESEERFRIVARVTADVVWDWNFTADTLWWGEGMYALFGHDPETLEPGPESWTLRIHPEDRERVHNDIMAVIEGGGTAWSSEYRFLRADSSVAHVSDRGYVIRDARGKAMRMVGSMIDVTNERVMQETLRRSQRMEALGQLTGGLAHDFNNLLTVILGNSELLADALGHDEKLKDLAEMTRHAAERGSELTSRLLAFARRQPLDPRATDVNRLVSGLDGLLRRTLGEHIEIEIVRSGGLWPALVDGPQLESAILNLCINSRDAMPGGGRLTIELANVHLDLAYAEMNDEVVPGQYVMVAVSDTGTGMTADTVERAFDPFFTTKEVGQGSGLGLSMVHGFIKQSKGHVKIYSEIGEGTTVKLYLPRAIRAEAGLEVRTNAVRIFKGLERVLVVEDDRLVRAHVTAQLRELGYQVTTAENGPQALVQLRSDAPFDLLFTDVVMPGGMSGRQLADEAQRLRPGLPVLFTSGYTENAIVHQGRLDPGVHLLQKPYRRNDLAAKLRKVLDEATGRG